MQAGWARERWTDHFFKETLPALAKNRILRPGGSIWLPYLECVRESINDFTAELKVHYDISLAQDPMENPLYAATEDVEDELTRCPDLLTNVTQIKPLDQFSDTPFLVLKSTGGPVGSDVSEPPLNNREKLSVAASFAGQSREVHVVTPTKTLKRKSRISGAAASEEAANSSSTVVATVSATSTHDSDRINNSQINSKEDANTISSKRTRESRKSLNTDFGLEKPKPVIFAPVPVENSREHAKSKRKRDH
jgi:hypothetical protein